jgi:hypothetical protein
MESNQLLDSLEKTFEACLDTARRKNADYAGNKNLSGKKNPYTNIEFCENFNVSAERGILVRMGDKLSRISNLIDNEAQVKDEAIEDTLMDMINYSAIMLAYREYKKSLQVGSGSIFPN